jgi:enoyl-CoA hydratase/carnithine racemase
VVIAAINGYAMGGGLECALSADIRVIEKQARVALPETAVGLLPAGCGTQTLPWLVGEGWAKRMILTGEQIDAETAQRIGLVEEVVEKGAAVQAALQMASRVIKLSPQAVAASKSLIHLAREGVPRHAALALERERFVELFEHQNQREGVNAFLQKREPQWSED